MLLENVSIPHFNTTLMGMIKGVLDYYNISVSNEMLFGLTGNAFMINIHKELCPSGPYCWNLEPFYKLLKNIGLLIKDEGFFSAENSIKDRMGIEKLLKDELDNRKPCGLMNLEFQLIYGYDDTGFITSQPWGPEHDFPPGHLTYTEWTELGNEFHISFFTFKKIGIKPEITAIIESLEYAKDLFENPSEHTLNDYAVGPGAYDIWTDALRKGKFLDRGNWWNAIVWSECRSYASAYFDEISKKYPSTSEEASQLQILYQAVSDMLLEVSKKDQPNNVKISMLMQSKETEEKCFELLNRIMDKLDKSSTFALKPEKRSFY